MTRRTLMLAMQALFALAFLGQASVQDARAQSTTVSISSPAAGSVLPLQSASKTIEVKGSGTYAQSGYIIVYIYATNPQTGARVGNALVYSGQPFGGFTTPSSYDITLNNQITTAGTYQIYVRVTDGGGNTVASSTAAVTAK